MATKKSTKTTKEVKREVELNPKFWDVPYNADLVTQVINVMRSNARQGNANAKRRSDVSGGGKKPWKQKGTGRARAGSNRSPLWIKGGVTFVPNFRNWSRKINKKMRDLAVRVLLSERLRSGALEFVSIDSKSSASESRKMMISQMKKGSNLIVTQDENCSLGLRNVEQVDVVRPENLNAFVLALSKNIFVDKEAVKVIEKVNENEK